MDFLDGLATRAASFTAAEAAITRHCFRALLAGAPASLTDLAVALRLSAEEVQAAIVSLTARGAIVTAGDDVVVASGLSRPPTPHRLVLDGRLRHVCCAVDAIGIPAALGAAARIESHCHSCHRPVTASVNATGAVTAEPASTVIWAASLDATRSGREFT